MASPTDQQILDQLVQMNKTLQEMLDILSFMLKMQGGDWRHPTYPHASDPPGH